MKKSLKLLALHRETLRDLTEGHLNRLVGGAVLTVPFCTFTTCRDQNPAKTEGTHCCE